MVDLNEVVVFIRVVEAGSFTGAASLLGMPKTSVSRKVTQLESSLGVRLLQRTTRKLHLTEVGRRYYEQCRNAVSELEAAKLAAIQSQAEPSGVLRISAPVDFGVKYLSHWVTEFLCQFDQVQLELRLTDQYLDLIDHGIDLAFRTGQLQDSSLIARKLGETRRVFCASPAYLERAGVPQSPEELQHHDCIIFGRSVTNTSWRFMQDAQEQMVAVNGRIALDYMQLVVQATVEGLGIAQIPEAIAVDEFESGRLRIILEPYSPPPGGVYAVYPNSLHLATSVRLFLDHVIAKTSLQPPWIGDTSK